MSDVDLLREQLRERGYLTHGIERWFALDPWSSRAFWVELILVALKAAVVIGVFGAFPLTAVMVLCNTPLGVAETVALFGTYSLAGMLASFILVVAVALLLKLQPALPIDTPRALLAISLAAAGLLVLPLAAWWYQFEARPEGAEAIIGATLLVVSFLVAVIVVSAALLSFSIYEVQRIPAIHRRSRIVPMAVAAVLLLAMLFVPAYARQERELVEPMVVTTPGERRIALIGVDGLTDEIFRSRPELAAALPHVRNVEGIEGESTAERWACLATGVRTRVHGVRAIEGVRFAGGSHVLQRISRADFILLRAAPAIGIARREPLPPTVRRRDYIWEIVAERGVRAVAVNWWATASASDAALEVVGPEVIFARAGGDPLRVDLLASARFLQSLDDSKPRLAGVYLPSLDVILNRVDTDPSTRLANSIRALEALATTVANVQERGFEVILTGMPGDGQRGDSVIASTIPLAAGTPWDLVPTTLALLGFPASDEMPGRTTTGPSEPRITSYGARASGAPARSVNEEYYENLRSLGYIR